MWRAITWRGSRSIFKHDSLIGNAAHFSRPTLALAAEW